MAESFKDHFSTRSSDYAAYRPTYPATLAELLAESAPGRETAVDCGCGAGQLSVLLAEQFEQVIALDASAPQLEHAKPHERVIYRQSRAEQTGMGDASADLVTVAQAAHWFDLDPFYTEVRRILRPGGVIALVTYGVMVADGHVGNVISHFYYDRLGGFWPPERRHVEAGYQTLAFPFEEFASPALAMEVSWNVDDLIGYVDTWSAVRNLEKASGREPFDTFVSELRSAWGDPDERRRIRWPLSVRAGRV